RRATEIVLDEDDPVHQFMMGKYVAGDSPGNKRVRAWMKENDVLRSHILDEIRKRGPLMSKDFQDKSEEGWYSTGWTSERNVSRMLDFLWITGALMVAGRKGGQKMWDLTERCLPEWAPRGVLPERELVYSAAQKSLRALGV